MLPRCIGVISIYTVRYSSAATYAAARFMCVPDSQEGYEWILTNFIGTVHDSYCRAAAEACLIMSPATGPFLRDVHHGASFDMKRYIHACERLGHPADWTDIDPPCAIDTQAEGGATC